MIFIRHIFFRASLPLLGILFPSILTAQEGNLAKALSEVDSNYIHTADEFITGRFYFSQKYTSIVLEGRKEVQDLRYRPNTTLNMGIGATYQSLSLNLAYGFQFLNRDKEKGKTRYLDLQTHLYPRNWTIDFFGQLYKGYFLFPKGLGNNDPKHYYLRPDVGVSLFGIALYNLTNGSRFSYRAAMLQSEWQKKSVGTWLIGGEIYAGSFSGDSALVPSLLKERYEQDEINKVRFLEMGPGGGYAYTLVVKRNFFIMGSATLNLDIGLSREFIHGETKDRISVSPNFIYRAVIGYNSKVWNLNVSLVGNRIAVRGASTSQDYLFNTGNYRLTFARKFLTGPVLKKKLRWIETL